MESFCGGSSAMAFSISLTVVIYSPPIKPCTIQSI
jgi:hypothetical protein